MNKTGVFIVSLACVSGASFYSGTLNSKPVSDRDQVLSVIEQCIREAIPETLSVDLWDAHYPRAILQQKENSLTPPMVVRDIDIYSGALRFYPGGTAPLAIPMKGLPDDLQMKIQKARQCLKLG